MVDYTPFHPVFLERRDDWWKAHTQKNLDVDDQEAFELVPLATAEQLTNLIYCEDCFPKRSE